MRFSTVATASAALVAGASAYSNGTVYTTEVVTSFTTYCPSPTTVVHNSQTYTVTEVRLSTFQWRVIAIWILEFRALEQGRADSNLGYYPDHHQLPVYRHQASHHLDGRVLLHLVIPLHDHNTSRSPKLTGSC